MTVIDLARTIFEPFVYTMGVAALFYGGVRGWKSLFNIPKGSIDSGIKNIALAIFNGFLLILVFGGFADFVKAAFEEWMPVVPEENWDNVPWPLGVLAVLVAADFANYWSHRMLHLRAFWGLHVLHHSDKHMNWTTVHRVHILEYLQMIVVATFLIGWLQLPTEAAAIAGGIRLWYSKYVHCQLGWNHGPLKKVLASPNYHRWHHANVPEAHGKNLCDMFPIWDVMFGTYYNPGPCEVPLGVDDVPDNLFLELVYPFRYWLEGLPVEPKTTAQDTA